jgi:osmotically-inducible protein OsmY
MPDHDRFRNRDRGRRESERRDQNDWQRFSHNREQDDDWAQQVNWERSQGPYEDYGWSSGQSVLPEFRDRSVRVMPYEQDRVNRWRSQEKRAGGRHFEDWNKEGPYKGVGPKNYKRSDERVMEDVCELLSDHDQIDARNIQVRVEDGEVHLEGTVGNRRTKHLIEDALDEVYGVKEVHNNLRVQVQR